MMRYASICSGIEAASVAWHPLGWEPVFFAEIEKFPSTVLAERWPGVPNLRDFTTTRNHCLRRLNIDPDRIDLLVGGTPCQSFSVAGKRLGMADPRGNLAIHFLKLAKRLRVRWLVWENVPGVLSSNKGRDFGAFLGLLGECGYGWAYRVLDAQHCRVDGFGRAVPQRRRRVFVIGYLGNYRSAAAILFERHCMRGDTPPRRKTGATAAALTANGVGTCGADDNQGQAGHLIAFGGNNTSGPIDVATACNAHGIRQDFETETLIAFSCKDNGRDAVEDCSPTLRAMGHGDSHTNGGGQMAVAVSLRGRDGGGQLEVGGAQSNALRASQGGSDKAHIFDGTVVRRLTPVECERLQGFADNYTRIPWRGKPAEKCPDGPRYKAIGNSMAVNVMRWLGQRIDLFEKLKKEGRI